MSVKEIFKKLSGFYVLGNLLAMLLVIILLCVGVWFGLDIYTRHGEGIEVPNLEDMTFDQAKVLLEERNLQIQVSDSGYNKRLPADIILAQTPGTGTTVKSGHVIYVTVNSPSSPTVIIPDLIDNSSLREAQAKLAAMGFNMLPPQRVPGEKDWVYGILCRGRRVGTGDRISTDSPLTLLVGTGGYEDDIDAVDYDDIGATEDEEASSATTAVEEFEEVTAPERTEAPAADNSETSE
ncbi:MAG: PASTA domain-containing protein [Prevotella sp.]|nr:PASTA domain-containing protein [Prevotella sp.]